jgi:hypothetical protein
MGKAVIGMLLVALVTVPVRAQSSLQAAKEAEIKLSVPFSEMRLTIPGLTLEQYNDAVRGLAQQELGVSGFSAPTPAPSVPRVPRYIPRTPYVPLYTPPVVQPYRRSSGTTTDPLSGNTYNWRRQSNGTTHVDGMNLYTGSMWQTDIKPNGSMSGYDKDFNPWTYDSRSKTYMNLGTSQMCIGEGLARSCF